MALTSHEKEEVLLTEGKFMKGSPYQKKKKKLRQVPIKVVIVLSNILFSILIAICPALGRRQIIWRPESGLFLNLKIAN